MATHPGLLAPEEPDKREALVRHVAWTKEQVFLSREALDNAERSHETALLALKAYDAAEDLR